jgi:hypothetical protein
MNGMTLGQLMQFHDEHRDELEGKSTTEVVAIIKRITKHARCSYLDYMAKRGARLERATTFVSHAWSDSFLELVDTLCHAFGSGGHVFWMDVVVVPQNDEDKPAGENVWFNAFEGILRGVRAVAIMLSRFDISVYPTRAWCLFELYVAMMLGLPITILLPPAERARFVAFLAGGGRFLDLFSRIDVADAKAFLEADRAKILELVRAAPGGVDVVNALVLEHLRGWLAGEAQAAHDGMPREERAGGGAAEEPGHHAL